MAQFIMMGMFISSIIGTLYYSGSGAANQSQLIRDKVSSVKQQTQDLKENISEINKNNIEIDLNIKNSITQSIKQHEVLSNQLLVANNDYAVRLKSIQLIGIITVSFIGMILILKKTKILDDIFGTTSNVSSKV